MPALTAAFISPAVLGQRYGRRMPTSLEHALIESPTKTPPGIRGAVSTGIAGLDEILGGGLTRGRIYPFEETPGIGKTTVGLQFLPDGAARGKCLYETLSEGIDALQAAADAHSWSLDGIELHELVNELGLDPDSEQSVLCPSEVELRETVREVIERIDDLYPARVVFDTQSELRLPAQNPSRYRRKVLALNQVFSPRGCTVLLLDNGTADIQLHSIAPGVIMLEQIRSGVGAAAPERPEGAGRVGPPASGAPGASIRGG